MCTSPLIMFERGKTKNGKKKLILSRKEALKTGFDYGRYIPCGKCLECRMSHAREFAARSSNEVAYHKNNIFFTLTFNPENCPDSLDYSDLQNFWKRLRKDINENPAAYLQADDDFHISYMACGEYGALRQRPHFHAVVYNLDFADRRPFYYDKKGNYWVYRSETLEKLWTFGFSTLGEVNFAVSQYVAGYIMKKQYGKDVRELYGDRKPEKVFVSQKPAIGYQWFLDNHTSMAYKGYIMQRNRDKWFKLHVPRYYLKKLEELYPDEYDYYQSQRPPLYTTADELKAHIEGRKTKLDSAYSRMLYQEVMNDEIERDVTDSYYTLSDNFGKSLDVEEL